MSAASTRVNREWHIALEFTGFDVVVRTLADRRWRLYVADDANGPFITCDRPIVLTWEKPEEIPERMRGSPGYGMRHTEVYFPITHKLAVVGVFDGPEERTETASAMFVAAANLRMIDHAFNQVYTIKRAFPYVGPPLAFYHDDRFMEPLAKRAQNGRL